MNALVLSLAFNVNFKEVYKFNLLLFNILFDF